MRSSFYVALRIYVCVQIIKRGRLIGRKLIQEGSCTEGPSTVAGYLLRFEMIKALDILE